MEGGNGDRKWDRYEGIGKGRKEERFWPNRVNRKMGKRRGISERKGRGRLNDS